MYPLDSAIHLLNNWGLVDTTLVATTFIQALRAIFKKNFAVCQFEFFTFNHQKQAIFELPQRG